MTEIVNLRLARKRRRRADKEKDAAETRIQHGRSAGERAEASSERALLTKRLDGHRREGQDGAGGEDAT
jgi:hypothetical protein